MARTTQREPCSDDEDWSTIEDCVERRKIQNRNNQRAFRKRRILVQQNKRANTQARRSVQPILLPKPIKPSLAESLANPMTVRNETDHDAEGFSWSISTPRPCTFRDMTGSGLDSESRRVFRYAATCLWPSFDQEVVQTGESIAVAMTRLAFTYELVMESFIWTAAAELEMHSFDIKNHRVMLKHQTKAVQMIRRGLELNEISEPLIFAVYAMVTSETPAGAFQRKAAISDRSISPRNDFSPPLLGLGWMDHMSKMSYSEKHTQAVIRLLEPRGGLEGMEVAGLADQMQAVDLVRNSWTGSKPSFNLCRSYKHVLELEMPFYRGKASFIECPISSEFQTLLLDMRCYLRQVRLYLKREQPHLSNEKLVAWRNINHYRVLSLAGDQDRLLRLGVLIFSYNVTFPVPFRDPVLVWIHELIPLLDQALGTSEAALWTTIIAAMSKPDEGTFGSLVSKARDITKSLGLTSWFELRIVLDKYLWLESACDDGGKRIWEHISTG